jgi:hypothetical protein
MVGIQVAIQEAELGDYPTALVREQGKADFVLVGKPPENLRRVVANSDQPDVVALKLGENLLQLDELRFAVSSPTRASEEDDERLAPCTPTVK